MLLSFHAVDSFNRTIFVSVSAPLFSAPALSVVLFLCVFFSLIAIRWGRKSTIENTAHAGHFALTCVRARDISDELYALAVMFHQHTPCSIFHVRLYLFRSFYYCTASNNAPAIRRCRRCVLWLRFGSTKVCVCVWSVRLVCTMHVIRYSLAVSQVSARARRRRRRHLGCEYVRGSSDRSAQWPGPM